MSKQSFKIDCSDLNGYSPEDIVEVLSGWLGAYSIIGSTLLVTLNRELEDSVFDDLLDALLRQ